MKRKFLILIGFVFIISMAAVSASDDLNQSEILKSTDGGTFDDLQKKIDEAPEGSQINLENDYVSDGSWGMSITKSLTINGNGHTLDADMFGSIFYIESDNVVLGNMSILNGFARDDNGGAILINANNTVIKDCHFRNNGIFSSFDSINGGAIYAKGNLMIINSIFEDNRISGIDNVIMSGGAVYCTTNLTIINCTFISNGIYSSQASLCGGAIYATDTAYISDSNFFNNGLSGKYVHGAAVRAGTAIINNSVFADNYAEASIGYYDSDVSSLGGAISAGVVNIDNSNFLNNSAIINDENHSSRGGGVHSSGITVIYNSNFTNNYADEGEALWAYFLNTTIENCSFINNDFDLVKADIEAPALVKYYHGSEKFLVYLNNEGEAVSNADVVININGRNYVRTTDGKGIASMAVNLNSGKYNAVVKYADSSVNSTIVVKPTISGENITKIFRNGTQYYATFVDTEGKTLANGTEVEFNINGVLYKRYTNENGIARMNINLNPGEYIITAYNPNSTEMYTNVITVLPSIVENNNLTKYYRNDLQYSVRILGDDGNPVGANVSVKFNINGVFYTRYTSESGYAKMNINLGSGDYIITAEYNGLRASNIITVLSVIETENLVMKYKDGSYFNATIMDGQGKPLANANVTFNINGVFYDRLTDDLGVAHLKINLMVGEYIITTMYNGLNASNKVTISSYNHLCN